MSPALKDIAVPLFCTALNEAPAEKMCKLEKLRNLWASNQYFDEAVISQLNDPVASMASYQAKILSENSDVSPEEPGCVVWWKNVVAIARPRSSHALDL